MCIWFSKGDLYEQIKNLVPCIAFIQLTVTTKKFLNPANIIKKQVEELITVLQPALFCFLFWFFKFL